MSWWPPWKSKPTWHDSGRRRWFTVLDHEFQGEFPEWERLVIQVVQGLFVSDDGQERWETLIIRELLPRVKPRQRRYLVDHDTKPPPPTVPMAPERAQTW